MEINLPRSDKKTTIDDEDCLLSQYRWRLSSDGYAVCDIKIGNKWTRHHLHRMVNNTPEGMYTDHINGDRLDNRRSNLRTVTLRQNQMNRKANKNKTSKFKGVYFDSGREKWKSHIKIDGKHKTIGYFKIEADAAQAYNFHAMENFGQYARLNIA